MMSEPFDAVSESIYMRTTCSGQEDPVHDSRQIAQFVDAPVARPGATRKRGTGPRKCPTCPFHDQNEGLAYEVSVVVRLRVG